MSEQIDEITVSQRRAPTVGDDRRAGNDGRAVLNVATTKRSHLVNVLY